TEHAVPCHRKPVTSAALLLQPTRRNVRLRADGAAMALPVVIHSAIDFFASYTPTPHPGEEGWALTVALLLICAIDGWFMLALAVRPHCAASSSRPSTTKHGSMINLEIEKIVVCMTSIYQPLGIIFFGYRAPAVHAGGEHDTGGFRRRRLA
ncbi:hypothetical protein FB451DRAFT_1434921, partial [Mycena latifolia]